MPNAVAACNGTAIVVGKYDYRVADETGAKDPLTTDIKIITVYQGKHGLLAAAMLRRQKRYRTEWK